MVTVHQIIQYIDERIAHMLERPQMFATTPVMLDELRDYAIHGPSTQPTTDRGYTKYLIENGYGALGFTSRQGETATPPLSRDDDFASLCTFWEGYLRGSQLRDNANKGQS